MIRVGTRIFASVDAIEVYAMRIAARVTVAKVHLLAKPSEQPKCVFVDFESNAFVSFRSFADE